MSKASYTYLLPFPPSVNGYWRTASVQIGRRRANRTLLSARARKYKTDVKKLMFTTDRPPEPITGPVVVTVTLSPPTHQARDIDNYMKPLFDVMTENGIWEDDSQVDVMIVARDAVVSPGSAVITVTPLTKRRYGGILKTLLRRVAFMFD